MIKGGKLGLKLYSTNVEAFAMAKELYGEKVVDYIELMAIPGTYKKTIANWADLNIPVVIHAPHSNYGFNLSDKGQRAINQQLFVDVRKFADSLAAEIIIVHPGLAGDVQETIRQIKSLKDKRIVVENMPFVSLMGTKCIGASPDEIKRILADAGSGFCLDIAHAFKSAFSHGRESYAYIKEFLNLKPRIVHLCGVKNGGYFDEHLNLTEGDIDLKKLGALIGRLNAYKLTLEVPENDYLALPDFIQDAKILKKKWGLRG